MEDNVRIYVAKHADSTSKTRYIYIYIFNFKQIVICDRGSLEESLFFATGGLMQVVAFSSGVGRVKQKL